MKIEINTEYKQINSLKRIVKNLNNEISNLIIEKNNTIKIIDTLNIKLKNLIKEIEEEKTLSKQILNFEFGKFFELSKQKMNKIIDEKDLNKSKLELLIEDLKTKYDEQKKYENLLEKSKDRIDYANNLTEQKHLDEISQHRYIQNKC